MYGAYIHKLMNNGRAITNGKSRENRIKCVCVRASASVHVYGVPLFEKFCMHCIDKYLMRSEKRVYERRDFARFKFQNQKKAR